MITNSIIHWLSKSEGSHKMYGAYFFQLYVIYKTHFISKSYAYIALMRF